METLIILQDGRALRAIRISDAQLEAINGVDYLQLDADGTLDAEFSVHGLAVCAAMQAIANGVR